jgi:SAM-dependent methyltransferase
MELLLIIGLVIALCFGGVLLFGAPYLPALTPQVDAALRLLDLKAGQSLLEIGSGDGKVVLAAAKRGVRVYGYELNPVLVIISKWRTRKYGDLVTIVWGNVWSKKLPLTDGVYVFGLDRFMEKLHTKVVQNIENPVRLVSVGFAIPAVKPTAQDNGVFLYILKPMPK